MPNDDSIVRANYLLLDLMQALSGRQLRLIIPTLFVGILLTVSNFAYAAPNLVSWPNCPPGPQVLAYSFGPNVPNPPNPPDRWPAHFQTLPLAGPSGGNCSLNVVSGSEENLQATSAGGFSFYTPGEVTGATYTISFDMQWVSGTNAWRFNNQAGDGHLNALAFDVPYPNDHCWRHYEFTAALVKSATNPYNAIPKGMMYVYQPNSGPQEIRIANLILSKVGSTPILIHQGLEVSKAEGGCCEPTTPSQR